MKKSKKIEKVRTSPPKKIDLSLKRLGRLLEKLNNPHLSLLQQFISQTNEDLFHPFKIIYENSKLKVQCYTSPHLIRFNERIRITLNL